MSHNHGVITIQAGMYANFVGTHWWNMQEASFCYDKDKAALLDINHDVLFREGLNHRQEATFTPRLLCIDLKENFKSMRAGNLYDEPHEEEINKRLKVFNNENRATEKSAYDYCDAVDQSNIWDGRVEVKAFHSAARETDSRSCYIGQNSHQVDQQSSSVVEIYNPEKVNMEVPSEHVKCTTDICWCHLHHDLPEPKAHHSQQCWSDFLNTGLHPKSQCVIDEFSLKDDSCNPLDVFGSGIQTYSCEDSRNDVENKLRWFVEECDYLQGFQVIVDAYNGFAGVADSILQHLDDEYQKKVTFAFPVFQNSHPIPLQDTVKKVHMRRLYSTLLSFSGFNNYCSIFSPLTVNQDLLSFETPYTFFPYAHLNPQLLYHSSAILAGALETFTASYRLKTRQFEMSDITKSTAFFGRKLLSTNVCFPFPIHTSMPLKNMVDSGWKIEWSPTSLTPLSDTLQHKSLSQFVVLRGVPESALQSSRIPACGKVSAEDLLFQYVQKYSPSSVLSMSVFDEKCKVTSSFPKFLCFRLNSSGYIMDHERALNSDVQSIPVASFLCNSSGTSDLLCKLLSQAEKLNLRSYAKVEDPFVEADDFNEAIQNLHCLKDCYGHDYS